MVHCSKILLNIWLFFFLLFSIPFTITAWLYYMRRGFHLRSCYVDNVWITKAYGILMFILCVIGIIGSLCRIRQLQSIFNMIVNIVIVLSLLVTLFYLFALPRAAPLMVWDRVYNSTDLWTKAYPPLLQTVLLNDGKWSSVKECLDEMHLCDPNASHSPETSRVYTLLLKSCCSPPIRCGLRNSSENHWQAPTTGLPPNDAAECKTWTKINNGRCYDCDMCKAAYLAKFHGDWKGIAIFHIFFMLFILMASIFLPVVAPLQNLNLGINDAILLIFLLVGLLEL